MKILVFDVPAEFGGVYTILKEFYNAVSIEGSDDWIFIVGKAPEIKDTKNITVKRYPWVKKNWIYRLLFDLFYAPCIIRKYSPNVVVSLQNNGIRGVSVPQVLYMHQAMMFSGKRYKIKESIIYWFYQNIQAKAAFHCMRKNYTIVQTKWMKNAIIEKANVEASRIFVVSPDIGEYEPIIYHDNIINRHSFFYPVNYMPYKRHDVILDAITTINNAEELPFTVYFTVDVPILRNFPKSTINHVVNTGRLRREQINQMYSNHILIFPSELESFGLPLLEARLSGTIILAAKTAFATEILEDYENAYFFSPGDSKELAVLMKRCMTGQIEYHVPNNKYEHNKDSGWNPIIEIIRKTAVEGIR